MLQIGDTSPLQHLVPPGKSNKDVKYLTDNLEFSENAASFFRRTAARRAYISWEDHYKFDSLETLLTSSRNRRPAVSVRKPIGVKTHCCHLEPLPNSRDPPPIIKHQEKGMNYPGVKKMPTRKSTFSVRSIPMDPSVNWGDRIKSAANNFETVCLRSDSLARISPDFSLSSVPAEYSPSPRRQVPEFVMEWKLGNKPVHQPLITLNDGEILLDNGLRFDKVLEPVHPPPRNKWQVGGQEDGEGRGKVWVQGQRRWQDWPRPHKDAKSEGWLSVNETRELESEREKQEKSLARSLANKRLNKCGVDPGACEGEKSSRASEEDFFLEEEKDFTPSKVLEEWLQKWNLPTPVSTVTPADLLDQMNSMNQIVRLQAAAHFSLLAGEQIGEYKSRLDEELVRLLTDDILKVRITAATALSFSEAGDTSQIKSVLLEGAASADREERWISSQALALMLVPHPSVLTELSRRLVSDAARERSRALLLLGGVSKCSEEVHAIAAGLVAATNWKEKIAGCSLVPLIDCGPKKDLQDQLVSTMWHNWHSKVREAAARALGRAEKGRCIHDEIQKKLTDEENEDLRLDALHKIGELRPPLTLLVPGLLSCMEDGVMSVRLRCIQLAREMSVTDDRVVDALIEQLKDDNWKVKLESINTLSTLSSGATSPQKIVSHLLWVGRYDRMSIVRASALRTLSSLARELSPSDHPDLMGHVVESLTESLSSDTEDSVRAEARKGLVALGEEVVEDDSLLLEIRSQIKRLGQPAEIAASILQSS